MMLYKITVTTLLLVILILSAGADGADTLFISARLDTLQKSVSGCLTVALPSSPPLTSFEFQLFPNVFATPETPYYSLESESRRAGDSSLWGGMTIDSIYLNNINVSGDLEIDYTKGILKAPLNRVFNNGRLAIYFRTAIPRSGDRLSRDGWDYLLDGWFPAPALLNSDGTWYNPYYGPMTELAGDFYHYDIALEIPRGYVAAASSMPSGTESGGDSLEILKYNFGPAHDFALALSPDFLIDSSHLAGIPFYIYYRDYEQSLLPRVRLAAERTLEYLSKNVGPYRYPSLSLAFVSSGYFGGVEFPGLVVVASPRGGPVLSRMLEMTVVHEITHQWFYGMMASDQSREPWLDEGLTSYFSHEIILSTWGERANLIDFWGLEATERGRLRTGLAAISQKYIFSQPAFSFAEPSGYYNSVYDHAALAMETLVNVMGDSLSTIFWKEYYNRFAFRHVSGEDFRAAMAEIAGDDYLRLFDKLALEPPRCDLSVLRLSNSPADSGGIKTILILSSSMILDFPIEYRLYFSNGDSLMGYWEQRYLTEELVFGDSLPVRAAVIDPEGKFAVDGDLLNNYLAVTPDHRPGLRLASGLMFLIESLFSYLGGF